MSLKVTKMLNNYLIDILIMNILVLLTINFYAPLQIHCTKLILHLGSTLQKLTLLKMTVFQSAENFVWGGGVTILSHSVDNFVR